MRLLAIKDVFDDDLNFVGTRRDYECTYSEAAALCGVRGLGMNTDSKLGFIEEISGPLGEYAGCYLHDIFARAGTLHLWEGGY